MRKKYCFLAGLLSVKFADFPHVCEVSLGTPVSSQSQRCAREANVVSTVSPSEGGCEWPCLARCPVRVGPSCPALPGEASASLTMNWGINRLENNNLTCFNSFFLNVCAATFLSVFNIRSFESLYSEI